MISSLHAQGFPGAFLPVSDGAAALSDYQLGWSLWFILIAGAVSALLVTPRRGFAVTLILGSSLLLLLLLPIPHVLEFLWTTLMPQAVCNLTYMWPMQRFYVWLGIMAVFLGYPSLALSAARGPWRQIALGLVLLAALAWSGSEAVPFINRGLASTSSDAFAHMKNFPNCRKIAC